MNTILEIKKIPNPNTLNSLQSLIEYETQKFENDKEQNERKLKNKILHLKCIMAEINSKEEQRYSMNLNDQETKYVLRILDGLSEFTEYCYDENYYRYPDERFYLHDRGVKIFRKKIIAAYEKVQRELPDDFYDPTFNGFQHLYDFLYLTKYYNLKLQIRTIAQEKDQSLYQEMLAKI